MAYADQQASGSKIVSLVVVALIHIVVIYALVTGLAYSAVKSVAEKLNVIDVEEEVPEEVEPPPPPPPQENVPPPVVTPPPIVRTPPVSAPVITTTPTPPPVFTPAPIAAPPAPPPPPPAPSRASGAEPRGNPGSWATPNDYPARALREERTGTTRFRLTIGTDGRATNCEVTGSSGHADLDQATCTNLMRRARFRPAMDTAGNPTTDTYSSAVRWEIPR